MEEEPMPWQQLSDGELQGKYLTEEEKAFGCVLDHIGRLEEQRRANGEPEPLPGWFNDHPAAKRLPRRPPVYFPKKCPRWIPEAVAGRPVMHPIWHWYHNQLRNGRCAKLRYAYKLPIDAAGCVLTPEDLADVKQMLKEVEQFNPNGNKSTEWPATSNQPC